jgi:hypothetical protein
MKHRLLELYRYLKAFFLVLTKPIWCSFSGLYRTYLFKKLERAERSNQKESAINE